MRNEMQRRMGKFAAAAVTSLLLGAATLSSAQAQVSSPWKFEVTPYLWAMGIKGDVTVGSQTATVDRSFSDIMEGSDGGASLLGVAQYQRWVLFGQVDYLSLNSDELDNVPARGNLKSKNTIGTLAAGYQFGGWRPGQTFDVMIGVRKLSMENTLALNGVGTFERDNDVTDTILMLRPSLPLTQRLRFNPSLSFGKGDSEKTYELWPQLQYEFTKNIAGRIGYRKLHYEIESDAGNRFKGDLSGIMLGLGIIF